MYVTDSNGITLVVKVALNPNIPSLLINLTKPNKSSRDTNLRHCTYSTKNGPSLQKIRFDSDVSLKCPLCFINTCRLPPPPHTHTHKQNV